MFNFVNNSFVPPLDLSYIKIEMVLSLTATNNYIGLLYGRARTRREYPFKINVDGSHLSTGS